MLEILKAPDPRLDMVCRRVNKSDQTHDFYNMLFDMKTVMQARNGVGIAAPQVGSDLRAFLIGTKAYVNPVIIDASESIVTPREQCLSVDHLDLTIKRHESLLVAYQPCSYYQEVVEPFITAQIDGAEAIVFQHELDHLDGILYTQRWAEQFAARFKTER